MKAKPFFITSLPSSRTAWMSVFCTTDQAYCRHETMSDLSCIEDLREVYDRSDYDFVGVSDCALGWFAPWILDNIQPRTVIIERPIDEVNAGIAKHGFTVTNWPDLLLPRLQSCRRHPLVKWVMFNDLEDEMVMREVFDHLMPGAAFDLNRFRLLNEMRIDTDPKAVIAKVQTRMENLNAMLGDAMKLVRPVEMIS